MSTAGDDGNVLDNGRDATIQTPCAASNTTAGSLTASYLLWIPCVFVMPGKNPKFQVTPPSCDVAQPMSAPPPPKTRPVWNALTMELPNANVSGSTSVRCWLAELWNGSALILTSVGAADAEAVATNDAANAAIRAAALLCTLMSLLQKT